MKMPFLLAVFAASLPITGNRSTSDAGEFSLRATLPLGASERAALRHLVERDPDAAMVFADVKVEAMEELDETPRPLAVIHYEGLVNTDPRRVKAVEDLRQMDDVAALLQYWQASDDPKAAATLRRFITTWAATYVPTGNDVNENKLLPIFVAYDGLRSGMPRDEQEVVDRWIARLGDLHAEAVQTTTLLNNRYTKHLRLLSLFGKILGREDWCEAANAGVKRFVTESLRPDGSSLDLEQRDSLTYHASALRPLIELALLAGPGGSELYRWESPTGASIAKSVNYVVPYASGEQTRKEWTKSRASIDRQRAEAGLEDYRPGRRFDPTSALGLVEEASFFDPTLEPLARRLREGRGGRFASWAMVVQAACRPGSRE